jgi:type IV secretion system protein VirB10
MPGAQQGEPLRGNPYANQYQRTAEPDLDAGAPQLHATELRRMNRRALLLLGAVVLLLLFVAYWMISGAGRSHAQPKPHEEKVTVTAAPAVPPPPLPPSRPQAVPLALDASLPATSTGSIPLLPQTPPSPAKSQTSPSAVPTLLQRRISASNAGNDAGVVAGAGAAVPDTTPEGVQERTRKLPGGTESQVTDARPLTHPDTLMQRGTYIRCVLETRIVSDIPGFSTCLVTEPVYSFNGHSLLLPKGSKLLGSYDSGPRGERMAVIWDRIITPTGIDVNMASPGIDNLGGAGLPGYYDAHWGKRISAALLISLLSDAFKYQAAEHGPKDTTVGNGFVAQTPFQSNTAQTIQNLADQAVREAANRPPTVTINQGTVLYVYVARDVDFSGVVARYEPTPLNGTRRISARP